jgi:DNA-binding transcriptional LysR family regulator
MPVASRFVAKLQARHPGIVPTLRSLSSVEMEVGLERLMLALALGYAERTDDNRAHLRVVPQYTEHYFLLRRARAPRSGPLRVDGSITWREAATLPLCMLSAEMHNRSIVDRAFAAVNTCVTPAIETNSTVTLLMSVVAGSVCSVLPGALLGAMQGYHELEAVPLVEPHVEVPIAFMVHDTNRPSRTLEAALAFAQDDVWLQLAARHSGPLLA